LVFEGENHHTAVKESLVGKENGLKVQKAKKVQGGGKNGGSFATFGVGREVGEKNKKKNPRRRPFKNLNTNETAEAENSKIHESVNTLELVSGGGSLSQKTKKGPNGKRGKEGRGNAGKGSGKGRGKSTGGLNKRTQNNPNRIQHTRGGKKKGPKKSK